MQDMWHFALEFFPSVELSVQHRCRELKVECWAHATYSCTQDEAGTNWNSHAGMPYSSALCCHMHNRIGLKPSELQQGNFMVPILHPTSPHMGANPPRAVGVQKSRQIYLGPQMW